jgi:signal transduction histidine kinase
MATMSDERARLQEAYEAQLRTLNLTIEKRERELAILSAVAARVHGEEDVDSILNIALDEILERMHLRTAWVFIGEQEERKLRLAAHRGVAQAYLDDIAERGLGECLCPEVFWSGHRMQARNTVQCPRMPDIVEGGVPVAHACIPLKLEGASRGVLNVAAAPGQQFSEEELRFLETVGHQVCLAIERARHLATERARSRENVRLYEELRQAYDDVRAAQARIIQSEKMAVLGTFASGLAHEVRNPLNSIGLQLSLLERRAVEVEGKAAKGVRDKITIIRSEIRRLDTLVNDFLLLSRTNRMSLRPVRLDDLAGELMGLVEPEAVASGVKLVRGQVGDPAPEIQVDPEKIKQVILNLLRNAIEAMPKGGEVRVETGLVDGKVRLRVSDTGPGLPSDIDVFALFVSTKPGGTGLGLSIVQQIVQDHGGEIAADSRPGEGTTFTIGLPVAALPLASEVLERKS